MKTNLSLEDFTYRLAKAEDVKFYYEIVSDSVSRQNSFNSDPISYESHEKWFSNKLTDEIARMYVIEIRNDRVGQVRLEKEGNSAIVDIGIHPTWRGKGLGSLSIEKVTKRILADGFADEAVAWIKLENVISQKAFEKAGFARDLNRPVKKNAGCWVYRIKGDPIEK